MRKKVFLSFLTASNSYQIIYDNILSGKRNRKDTKSNDPNIADSIFKAFEKEYIEKLQIHNEQIQNNSTGHNLKLNKEVTLSNNSSELTFKDTLKTILNYYANQNNGNREVQNDIRRHYSYVIEYIGNKKLSEYKMLDFENYKSIRLKMVKAGTVNCEIRNLKAYFNRMVDYELIIKNPLNKIKQIENFSVRLEFKNEEMKAILNDTIKTKNDLMYYVINIGYLTGMRLSEIINLKWQDIDFNEDVIYVLNKFSEGFTTKSGKERFVPLEKNLKPILLKLKEMDTHNNYVISKTNGYKYSPDFISSQFRMILKKLKINESHCFHSCRHTFATNYLAAGGNIYNLQAILGHSKITVTERYAHKNKKTMVAEMKTLSLAV